MRRSAAAAALLLAAVLLLPGEEAGGTSSLGCGTYMEAHTIKWYLVKTCLDMSDRHRNTLLGILGVEAGPGTGIVVGPRCGKDGVDLIKEIVRQAVADDGEFTFWAWLSPTGKQLEGVHVRAKRPAVCPGNKDECHTLGVRVNGIEPKPSFDAQARTFAHEALHHDGAGHVFVGGTDCGVFCPGFEACLPGGTVPTGDCAPPATDRCW